MLQILNVQNDENNGIKIPRHFFSYACNGFDLQLKEAAANSFYERAVIERFRKRSGQLGKVCIQRSGDLREDLTRMGFSESI